MRPIALTEKGFQMRIEFNIAQKRFMMLSGLLAVLLLSVSVFSSRSTVAMAQDQQGQPSGGGRSNVIFASEENYRIGANDVIEIQVEKWVEISGTFAVNADGTIAMKFLGTLTAQGKSVNQIASEIADLLLRNGYLKSPQVTVSVKQYNSRTFFVQGAVRSPGMFVVVGKPSLMTLLNLAGGLQTEHGSTAFVIRKLPQQAAPKPASETTSSDDVEGKEQYELLKASLNKLYEGDFSQNLTILPGDTIHVPPADLFFVAGEVIKPGSFQLRQGLTLRQAVSQAGGVTPKAKASEAFILRQNPSGGEPIKVQINISEVMKADKPDIPIEPNDYVFIPSSKLKSFSNVLLNGFGMNWIRVPWVN